MAIGAAELVGPRSMNPIYLVRISYLRSSEFRFHRFLCRRPDKLDVRAIVGQAALDELRVPSVIEGRVALQKCRIHDESRQIDKFILSDCRD